MEDKNNINPAEGQNRSSIRTYERDASEALKNQDSSLSSIFIAEQKKKEKLEVPEESRRPRRWPYIIFGIVFLIGAISLIALVAIRFFPINNNEPAPVVISSKIVVSNEEIVVDVTDLSALEIQNKLQDIKNNNTLKTGNILAINLVSSTTESIKTSEMFSKLSWRVPGKLNRSLEEDFAIGVNSSGGNQPFIVFKVLSYEQAFAGMLEWEKNMTTDLGLFFGIPETSGNTVLGETSTTTSITKDVFVDKVIKNKDTRVLTRNGSPVFLYSFSDRKTLIITTTEEAFKEIMSHLSSDRF